MCLVLADDHRFLIGCKSARTAPANSGSLKVPGPIQPNFTESSVYTGPEQNQLCSTQAGPETLSPRGACKDFLLQANRYPGGFSVLLGSCLLLQNTSECVRAAILKTKKSFWTESSVFFLLLKDKPLRSSHFPAVVCGTAGKPNSKSTRFYRCAHEIYLRPYNSQMSE